ncbi:hypothetical protein E2C01_086387 [Portunus trituberculatus]|uniref:Uncharacterized protein n=1 Tax=Portunus trituberculatus TaxID=210409 RepID=A0A5B7JEG4_PORTR|nr:hypothetical protein [Portunus trituberculatus]
MGSIIHPLTLTPALFSSSVTLPRPPHPQGLRNTTGFFCNIPCVPEDSWVLCNTFETSQRHWELCEYDF